MILTDTHAHLYLEQFGDDRSEMVLRAMAKGIRYMILPNIDRDSIKPMLDLCSEFPENCFPMMGLHPTSVREDFGEQLKIVEDWIRKGTFYAVGEMGIDLYWDKTYFSQQQEAFRFQVNLALETDLPIVIHSRESFDEIFTLLDETRDSALRGIFHCFTGNRQQAEHIIRMGFKLGIGGVLTYKNSGLKEVIKDIPLEHLLLETDAPFLSPVPHRGTRNESAYIYDIARVLAEVKNVSLEEVAKVTTRNAIDMFGI